MIKVIADSNRVSHLMSTIQDLEAKVKSLNPQELAEFREWFRRFEDEVWDRKIR